MERHIFVNQCMEDEDANPATSTGDEQSIVEEMD